MSVSDILDCRMPWLQALACYGCVYGDVVPGAFHCARGHRESKTSIRLGNTVDITGGRATDIYRSVG